MREIVYGTGEKMRTGEAAGPDTLDQQWEIGKAQISPFGPTQMDPQRLVSGAQGTMGIVTWMSIKCRHLSVKHNAFLIPGITLEPMVELMNKLTGIRFTGNIFILNGLNLACLVRQTSQEIVTLAQKMPPYVMFVSCEGYGPLPEEKVQYLEEDLKELSASFGLKPENSIENVKAEEFSALMALPSADPYWKLRLKDGFAELFFLTTQSKVPEFVKAMADIAQQQGYSTDNIGSYFQPVVMGTSCHCEFDFYYDPTDQAAVENTRKIVLEAADKMETMGAFFSRPYGDWTDIAYRRCQDTVEMQKKVKGIFDPNGILNPGQLCFR